jgi:uncharacterized protein
MSLYFLDASALVKRYVTEAGSEHIRQLCGSIMHQIIIAELTQVEVAAALAAKHRSPQGISRATRDSAVNLLAEHCQKEYELVNLTPSILSRAVSLTQQYRLRGYDAVQLATAVAAEHAFKQMGLSTITFLAADIDLLVAAEKEGLAIENPQHYV